MNSEKAYNYFHNKFNLVKSTKGWYRFKNPFDLSHEDNSMAVNFEYLWIKDFRTGYSKSVIGFIKQLENLDYKTINELIESQSERKLIFKTYSRRKNVKLPEGFSSFILDNNSLAKRCRSYIESRGFDPQELDYEGFGYCWSGDWMGYLIIPVKSKNQLRYFFGRTFIDSGIRYKNPGGYDAKNYFYNEDALYIHDTVYITEGWSDAKTLGSKGIATLSWNISDTQIDKINKSPCKNVYIIADEGYYKQALKNSYRFIDYKNIFVISLDHLGKDVNDVGKKLVMDEIEKSKQLDVTSLINKLYSV